MNENPLCVTATVNLFLSKIARGSDREKIVLSSKSAVIERLESYVDINKNKPGMRSDAERIGEFAKKYAGLPLPESDGRYSGGRHVGSGKIERLKEGDSKDSLIDRLLNQAPMFCGAAIFGVFFVVLWIMIARSKRA